MEEIKIVTFPFNNSIIKLEEKKMEGKKERKRDGMLKTVRKYKIRELIIRINMFRIPYSRTDTSFSITTEIITGIY